MYEIIKNSWHIIQDTLSLYNRSYNVCSLYSMLSKLLYIYIGMYSHPKRWSPNSDCFVLATSGNCTNKCILYWLMYTVAEDESAT